MSCGPPPLRANGDGRPRAAAVGAEDVEQAVREAGGLEDGPQQRRAPARLAVARDRKQRPAQLRMAAETLGAADQPEVEPVLQRARVRGELVVKALGIVDQVAGVNVEELRQEEARRVAQVAAGAALDLGQVRLAGRAPVLLL